MKDELVGRLDPYDKKTILILKQLGNDLFQGRDDVGYREMGEKVTELIYHPQRDSFVAAICETDFLKAAGGMADQVLNMPELTGLIFEFVGGKNIPGQDKKARAEEARKFSAAALKYYGIRPNKPEVITPPQIQNNNFNDLPPIPPASGGFTVVGAEAMRKRSASEEINFDDSDNEQPKKKPKGVTR